MSTPTTLCDLFGLLGKSALVPEPTLNELAASRRLPNDPTLALDALVRSRLLTRFQAQHLQAGKYKGFVVGPYKVLRPLGKGGMGVVYLAEHTQSHQLVAVKVLRNDLAAKLGIRERFQREWRVAATLDHPNIVGMHEAYWESESPCLIMEYIEGKSLRTILHERGRLPIPQAVRYVVQVARGLDHAHAHGILHRDIKPGNLMVTPDDVVKILDMGLARFEDDRHDGLTERLGGNLVLGSADFIAPEQVRNQADSRSDLYSLGATLYMLLLGQAPFHGGLAADKLLGHCTRPVRPLHLCDASIPEELSWIVLRMMAKDPAARFQSAAEVVAALTPFIARPRQQMIAPSSHRRTITSRARELLVRMGRWMGSSTGCYPLTSRALS